jgi:hypothetical protein
MIVFKEKVLRTLAGWQFLADLEERSPRNMQIAFFILWGSIAFRPFSPVQRDVLGAIMTGCERVPAKAIDLDLCRTDRPLVGVLDH